MYKEIIILAKSTKRGDFCIAGVDVVTGEWIRPISSNSATEGAVPAKDIVYEDGTEVEILDKVRIRFSSQNPTKSQPENYVYDDKCYWENTGKSTIAEVIGFRGYDSVEHVFYNNGKSVTDAQLKGGPSLLLLEVESPQIVVKTFENKKVTLDFRYNQEQYSYFALSDINFKQKYIGCSDGRYTISDSLNVVFSLTDRYTDNKYYKMVAQVFC